MASKSSKLLLLAMVVALAGCNRAAPPVETAPAAPATGAPATGATEPAAAPVAELPPIERIMDGSLIGTKLSFFERFSGEPTYATVEKSDYVVGGCRVSALTDGETVNAIRIGISAGCTAILPGSHGSLRLMEGLTFADFDTAFVGTRYKAPCTGRYCGNAFEPYVDAVVPGVHANNFVDVVATAYFIGDAIDASNVWEAQMQAEAGDSFLEQNGFNCDRRFDAAARAAFAAIKIEEITFGNGLDRLDCETGD